jgi:dipeptidyl aminopeptidase/acylaminoacyl peptidase
MQTKRTRVVYGAVFGAILNTVGGMAQADEARYMPVPKNIETRNVPTIPLAQANRLARYSETRAAGLYGWQGDRLLVSTRFANTKQMHRVARPMGSREQLTFLQEPLVDVALPNGGAGDEIIISSDVGGSEFNQLFLFNLASGTSRRVSDGKSRYGATVWAPDGEKFAYVTTERNGRNWDTHIQGLDGHINKVFETEDGYWYPIGWHPAGDRLLLKHRVSINVSSIYELDLLSRKVRPLVHSEGEDVAVPHAAYDDDGGLYFLSDQGHDYQQLMHMDLASGDVENITEGVNWNVRSFVLSPERDRLAYELNEGGYSRLVVLNLPSHKPVRMPELPEGMLGAVEFSANGRQVAFAMTTTTSPSDVYVIDLKKRSVKRWTESEVGGLDRSTFVNAEMIEYPSFDGKSIPAFVYRPTTPGPHAVVVYIHGGPEGQYRPNFSILMQSYVNEMNVVVIAPNVRGSRGYGKTYLKLDDGFAREDSVKDIGALLDWIDNQTSLRSDRVAVMGGSYGGYMVLASMVHFGHRLAAAVESVGISNFVTFLENTQAYRQDIRRVEYGDERQPKMRAHLQAISPLNQVDKMQTPLLISQGANDPRVPASESEQIFSALKAKGTPVWYVLAHDEGHGMRKKINRDYDRAAKFSFLDAYLNRE